LKFLNFENREQWRAWLEKNWATEGEAWVVHYKKKFSDQGLTLDEAVEEALCFGWIDSTLNRLDEKRYTLRYSPRKADSVWSMSNIRRVENLIAEGKMTAAGQQKIDEAKENGQWEAAVRREQVDIIPEELEWALLDHEGAMAAYQALPDSQKKRYIYWLQSAKRKDTKQRRIQKIVKEVLGQ
jgi:uncharacterized protein YdeI (YjbR/CyaY-like superfamily)